MKLVLFLIIALYGTYLQAQIENPILCEWEQDLTDEFSGRKKKQLKTRKFFGYSPEGSSRFFVGKEYLECWAALAELDDKYMLNVNIIIQDHEIEAQMGDIAPNASLELTSIKGKTIYLITFAGCKAQIKDKNTIYNCNYFIPKTSLKKLRNFEIDTVKINWSKAYQVYTVFYLDFLSDQIKCFE